MKLILFSIAFFAIVQVSSQTQPFRQGATFHYKGSIIVDEDSENAKVLSDFKIHVDTVIHVNNFGTIVVLSKFFDNAYIDDPKLPKTVFLYSKEKVYKVFANDIVKFCNDYSTNPNYWDRQIKDTLRSQDSYNNAVSDIYNFVPFLNIGDNHNCEYYDSIRYLSGKNEDSFGTFACKENWKTFKVHNQDEKVYNYIYSQKRANNNYYYSKKSAIVSFVSHRQWQSHFYYIEFLLFKID